MSSPVLHSTTGAQLNLRSQLLFHDNMRDKPNDLVTSLMSWNLVHAHETSHWVRFHGSTIGVLLTFLRATRDSLADYSIRNLDNNDRAAFEKHRNDGIPLFAWNTKASAYSLGREITDNCLTWLSLHRAYSILLGFEPLNWSKIDQEAMQDSLTLALHTTWSQWTGRGMLPLESEDYARVHSFGPLLGGDEPITTRLLFECAGLLDEGYLFRGPHPGIMDRGLQRMWDINRRGEYGKPYRLAESMAGRSLSHSEVLTLIDFALNPPLPGLNKGVRTIDWRELYPPYRFLFAAAEMAERRIYKHSEAVNARPTIDHVSNFYSTVTRETDIRVGSIDCQLTEDSDLRDIADPRRSFAQRMMGVPLLSSDRLHGERRADVRSISHFGSLLIDMDGYRLLDPEAPDYPWWFFPPLKVINDGVYGWPAKRLSLDEASDLLIGSAISSAYDDVVHGVGPLGRDHLPAAPFRDPDETAALNDMARYHLGVNIGWT
ncbi:hypothetical protein PV729_00935 [Streptomyces europaeiscabiei]|uniref:Uncharacterized protein n=1 Tax=Streptomyces europaeiscabiei TaxID=146819 RepID=A0ABU4N7S9_9ACTN|nr:hypothetical protein [Streptomyces europaeiscabiei]MDX3542483.1 hypothetical protein [Streptomyces europaeiscabiei]MDX3550349.1 hypothetical protein [Streptomyces europaeiscabiei]MDX3699091.1 hypothetical protein [Streptomyces europaeiscabiei]MDX3832445.1 hypothetical protein [Streptomyces europaeiscabiei]